MSDKNSVALPRTVAWLGYGGLLPFLVLTPASLLDTIMAWYGVMRSTPTGRSFSVLSAHCIEGWQ